LIDTDPQGSLADWWNARDDGTLLFVHTAVDCIADTLEELRAAGVKLVFIETQPTVTEVIKTIVRSADLVIIPTRPSPHDLRAVGPTLDLVEACEKPMIFVVNSATRRARITGDVAVALSQHGTVAPVTIHNRVDFATSMINGRSVVELSPESASAKEIQGLWAYISERLRRLKSPDPIFTDEPHLDDEEISDLDDEETSDVNEILDLLGFDEDTDTTEIVDFPEGVVAAKETPEFGRRATFGRRGVASAAEA
jgi:chromosome partitioning protein